MRRGFVASNLNDNPAFECETFEAQVIILNHPKTIKNGYTPILDCGTAHVPTKFLKIRNKIDRRTGKVKELNPKSIKNGDCSMIQLKPMKPLTVETFTEFPPLGRFTIRDMKRTVAVGVIKEVTPVDPTKKVVVVKKISKKKLRKMKKEKDAKEGKVEPKKGE